MLKSAQAVAGIFVTLDSDGALSTPTVGPVGTLYVNGVSNAAVVTISGTNPYKFALTLPTLNAGDICQMYVTATVDSIPTAGVVWTDIADTKRTSDLQDPTVNEIADGVWDEALLGHATAGTAGKSLSTAAALQGAGAVSKTLTVNDGTNPLDGVEVWATSDAAGNNVVASGSTDALGQITILLDAGTYYVWCQLGGYNFTNPATVVWA